MKKLFARLLALQGGVTRGAMKIMLASFLIGAVVGGIFAAYGGEAEELAAKSLLPEAGRLTAFDSALTMFRYPIVALLCGFAVFGVIAEPLICAARGFFLCFAATALMRLYGAAGLGIAAAASAVECVISIPCLIYLAAGGFSTSSLIAACLGGRAKPGAMLTKGYVVRVLLIAAILTLGAVAETYLTPILTSFATSSIR